MAVLSRGVNVVQAGLTHQYFGPRRRAQATGRGVIWCPGVANTETTPLIPPLTDLGYGLATRRPVLTFASPGTWGNDTSIGRVEALRNWFPTHFPVPSDGFHLVGVSHGCPISLNWARQHKTLVKSVALVIPAVDVEDIRANNRGGYQASIETAYTDNTSWQAARATHNPIEYVATDLAGIPMKIWYGAADAICIPSRVEAFAALAGAELRSLGDVGHDMSTVQYGELADFFDAHS